MRLKGNSVNRLVLAGLLAAIIFVLTLVHVPIPTVAGAYINLGDAGVFAAAFLLGWPWGAMAAAVGSALADIVLGSAIYAGATFLIKGAMALLAVFLFKKWKHHLPALLCAGLLMPLGYYLYEAVFLALGPAALIDVLWNLLQYAAGVAVGLLLIRLSGRFKKGGNA